jgi:hypothetical protein
MESQTAMAADPQQFFADEAMMQCDRAPEEKTAKQCYKGMP